MTALVALVHSETGEVRRVAADDAEREAVGPWSVLAVVPAEPFRAEVRARINRARDEAKSGGIDTPFGRFDTSTKKDSRGDITGAVVMAMNAALLPPETFPIKFTLADDSEVFLQPAQMIAAGLIVAAGVDAIHQRARVLKERIEAAQTYDELQAITWTLVDPE